MSFGIITRAVDGSENFRGEFQTLRIVYHQTVAAGFTGNISIPNINPFNAVAFCIPRNNMPYDRNLLPQVGDGFVNLTRFNNSYPPKTTLDLIVMAIS